MKCTINNFLVLSDIPTQFYNKICLELTQENPKWLNMVRMGKRAYRIPRYVHFFRKRKNNILAVPRGWGYHLAKFAKDENIEIEYIDVRRELPSIEFRFHGQLKPFQQTAIEHLSKRHFSTLSAPCGAGKTVCAIAMIALRAQPTLVLVHTKDLLYQWISRIEQFLDIPSKEIGIIGDGKYKLGEKITISTVQSLYKYSKEVLKHIGHIIVDECHRAPSKMFTKAVTLFDCKYSLGLSATPWRQDGLSDMIFWYLGELLFKVEEQELFELGDILQPEIIFRDTKFKTNSINCAENYAALLTEISEDGARNQIIITDVIAEYKNQTGVLLILTARRQHCFEFVNLLKDKNIDADILTGQSSPEERKNLTKKLQQKKNGILIATGQLIGEGFDCSSLTTLFLASPVKFDGRLRQYIGRVMRPAPDKKPKIYDYIDVNIHSLVKASDARKTVYSELTFEVSNDSRTS